jgi:two-component system cell cycle sensor histidine kinase/response regulator CckA
VAPLPYALPVGGEVDEGAVFVTGPVVLFRWRNEPGWPVEYVSPNAVEVFGHTADDFLSRRVVYAELIAPEDLERVGREVAGASGSDVESFVHEPYRIARKDGAVRWLYDSTRIVRTEDGRPTHFLGYVIDITARVEAEEEKRELERRLLHAQKLESLGILAGGVAHDFNNLLTGIVGHASLAKRALEASPDRASESLEQIDRLAQKASDLTRRLLAYAGKGRFVVGPTDVGAIVRDMASMLEVVLSKKATLRVSVDGGLPGVMADRSQLQQVVMNLLTNASEALGEGAGDIDVTVERVALDGEGLAPYDGFGLVPGVYVRLAVRDTGCGMPPAVFDKLFDPFFTTKESGRGLGMSAVLGIVRGHRGAIRVVTAPNSGTLFDIVLPATTALPIPRAPEPVGEGWRGAGAILVVDDESTIRRLLARTVAAMGFDTIEAANGQRALMAFDERREEIVLVLLDMTMPVMGGAETLRELRRRSASLPVVMMSGYSEELSLEKVAEHPVSGFLEKPYRVEDVEAVIRRVLSEPCAVG